MFKITFTDGTIFTDKNNVKRDSKWNTMPNKSIKRLIHDFAGAKIILENFESYNHLIKIANVILGGNFNGIAGIIILAKSNNKAVRCIYNLMNGEFKQEVVDINELQPSTGWKKGLQNATPTISINGKKIIL